MSVWVRKIKLVSFFSLFVCACHFSFCFHHNYDRIEALWNYCIVLDFLGFRSNGDTFLSIENGTFGDISAGNHLQLN